MDASKSLIVVYDVVTKSFMFPEDILPEDKFLFECHIDQIKEDLEVYSKYKAPIAYFLEVASDDIKDKIKNFIIGFVSAEPWRKINIVITDISVQKASTREMRYLMDFDSLTGLYNRDSFTRRVDITLLSNKEKKEDGKYALVYLDVVQFKAVNEIFGQMTADSVLQHISTSIKNLVSDRGFGCRIGSDRFCLFVESYGQALEQSLQILLEQVANYMSTYRIICNIGVYVTCKEELTAQEMVGRAILAQNVVKGNVKEKINYYRDEMRKDMLTEQEITGLMNNALKKGEFVVYYQPQYDHSTKKLIGAEALVRWFHPEKGMMSPATFIPIFENNGFITNLDLYVFDNVCGFIEKKLKENVDIVPISSNFSRYDLFDPDFIFRLEHIRKRHKVDAKYLRIEITESAFVGDSNYINSLISKLHNYGYVVEMDDFGSGYSSLNTLKDIDFDIIKLDMKFLQEEINTSRGGAILSSVVKMANRLNLPIIAEGVETQEQADFLKSIGSDYIQGYFYSRPLPESDFEKLLCSKQLGSMSMRQILFDSISDGIWNPASLDSLIFNSFVGPAAIFEYSNGKIEYSRINKKYLEEIGMRESEREILLHQNPLDTLRPDDKKKFIQTIENIIYDGQERRIETWRKVTSKSCGTATLCIRSELQLLKKRKDFCLLFANIRNITTDRYTQLDPCVLDEAETYHWEYVVDTKEMFPCKRCMQDLSLPNRLENYPEPLIENGFFPSEIADQYRNMMKEIDAGKVSHLECVLPLTQDRVPYMVKYDVEFNSLGRPVKAYGSASLHKE